MKTACVKKIDKARDTLVDLIDGLEALQIGIESDNEDKVNGALDMFPTPKAVSVALGHVQDLVEKRPWEDKRRKHG